MSRSGEHYALKQPGKVARAPVWASKGFRYGVPAFLMLLFFAGSYIKAFFDAEPRP